MLSRRIILLIILMFVTILFYGCQKVPDSVISTTLYTSDSVTKVLSNPRMKNIDTIRMILKRDLHKMDKSAEFLYHYKLGKLYREESNFKESVRQHRIAQRIALDLRDTTFIVRVSNQMGTDFRRIGALADAARMHLHALKIASSYSKKDSRIGKRLLSFSLNGVGNVYKSLGNGKEAFSFFKRSAGYDEELKNYIGLAVNHVTMGSILEQQGRADSAYIYYQRAMHYDSLMNSKKGIAICHNRMGKLFLRMEKWEKALYHYRNAENILEGIDNVWNILRTKVDMAWIYIQQKKYNQAKVLLDSANIKAKEGKMYGYLEKIQYFKGILHTELKEYKEAGKSWKLCLDYRDSIENMKSEQNILDMRIKFEKEKNNQRIEALSKINESERSKKRIIVITGLGLLFMLIILLFMSYHLFRIQRRRNKILKDSNVLRDKLFSIISHDLKAPAIAQKVAIDNLKPQINDLDNINIKEFFEILSDSVDNQINVVDNLMNWARVQSDKIKYTPQAIDIVSIIHEELKLYTVAIQQKSINIDVSLPKTCIVKADRQMVAIVIRNLINNAMKFTNIEGNIQIFCKNKGKMVSVYVKDDGVGMDEEQISALYDTEKQVKISFGTRGEKGTGLGLILCRELLEQNESCLLIDSQKGKGTTMSFTLIKIED